MIYKNGELCEAKCETCLRHKNYKSDGYMCNGRILKENEIPAFYDECEEYRNEEEKKQYEWSDCYTCKHSQYLPEDGVVRCYADNLKPKDININKVIDYSSSCTQHEYND